MGKPDCCIHPGLVQKAQPIVTLLREQNLSVVTAESCTAGLIGAIISHVPGAGDCLQGGFITYSKAHKTSALGVDAELLRAQGSVNSHVARQMAEGALRHSVANLAVAVTGVLGPEPDEDNAPPGLIFFAVARSGFDTVITQEMFDASHPDEVRFRAVAQALNLLLTVARA
jgi:nicotinamide-nucleotide amidase